MASKFSITPLPTKGVPLVDFDAPKKAQASVSVDRTQPQAQAVKSKVVETVKNTPIGKIVRGDVKGGLKDVVQRVEKIATDPEELALSFGPAGLTSQGSKIVSNLIPDKPKAVSKVISALEEAKPLRREVETAMTAERGRRIGQAQQAFETIRGEAGVKAAFGKLKGELVPDKPTFSPIRQVLDQTDVDELYNSIHQSKFLSEFEKISADDGLKNLFEGKIPQPKQISMLEDVFGQDFIRAVLSKKGGPSLWDITKDIANIPRAVITSIDSSAVLRQGAILTSSHPLLAAKNAGTALKDIFSPQNYKAWFTKVADDPAFRLFKDNGGYISNADKISDISGKEEKFMTTMIEKIPVLRSIVKASERGYTSYLNKMRFDVYKQVSSKFIKMGLNPTVDKKAFEDLADFVNAATGRGDLPGQLGRISQGLNTVFFSPRLIASRLQFLNPTWYAKQHPAVRKEAVKSFAEFAGVVLTIGQLAKLGGAEVELDPRSSDFLKIRVGDSRWDLAAGFSQFVRLFAQMATGERKTLDSKDIISLSGDKFPFETRGDVALRFLRSKLAPVPSLVTDLMFGAKNVVGDDLTLGQEFLDNIIPLYMQDIAEAYNEFGPSALFTVGIPGFFGAGTQTFERNEGSSSKSNSSGKSLISF